MADGRRRSGFATSSLVASRRRFLRSSLAAGAATLGASVLDWAGLAAPVSADAPGNEGYEIDLRCYRADYPESEWNCTVACGPSLASSSFCDSNHWHKNYDVNGTQYRLRPNVCTGPGSSGPDPGDWDGWKWSERCRGCGPTVYELGTKWFRCHDGRFRPPGGSFVNSICQWSFCQR